jgi:glyoxylase-like metal-dependent hydrolase (beta-lactamase superfamily II)
MPHHTLVRFRIYAIPCAEISVRIDSLLRFPPKENEKEFARQTFTKGFREAFRWSDGSTSYAVSIPVIMWYVEGDSGKFIVDTSLRKRKYSEGGEEPHVKRERLIENSLSKVGVRTEEIDYVINTHLHTDHAGNNLLFKNANFVVQKKEIPFALTPSPWTPYYSAKQSEWLNTHSKRLVIVDGDAVLAEGVRVYRLGGHTPGSQAVIIGNGESKVGIAGDVVPTFFNLENRWPTGSFWCLDEVLSGMNRLRTECATVLPSHDWELWERYPSGTVSCS